MFRECQLVHTVGVRSTTSTGSSAKHHGEEVPGLGQLVPGQLHGCGVAGKGPVLSKPRRGFCICSAVDLPAPTTLPLQPPPPSFSPSALRQLRPAGETAGRCCQGERRVCLRACTFSWMGGSSSDITARVMLLNTRWPMQILHIVLNSNRIHSRWSERPCSLFGLRFFSQAKILSVLLL